MQLTGHNKRPLIVLKRCKARTQRRLAAAIKAGARNRYGKGLLMKLARKNELEAARAELEKRAGL